MRDIIRSNFSNLVRVRVRARVRVRVRVRVRARVNLLLVELARGLLRLLGLVQAEQLAHVHLLLRGSARVRARARVRHP